MGSSPWGGEDLDMTEQLSTHTRDVMDKPAAPHLNKVIRLSDNSYGIANGIMTVHKTLK